MTRKGKQVVWHKKSGKMIPSQLSKLPGKKPDADHSSADTGDKMRNFALKLKAQIKKAASEDNC